MTTVATLRSALSWSAVQLPADPATGSIALRFAQVDGGASGPSVTITCGIHGDEGPWGALAVQRVLERPLSELKGRLQLVLAANPTSVAADTRCSPLDQLDLNRCFPGSDTGSHSERLAAALADVVAGSDVLIDLHGGGSWCVNAFTFRFPGSESLADAVGAPFVVDRPLGSGNLAGHVAAAGTRVVAIEMGGRSVAEMAWRDRLADGVERVLTVAGSLPKRLPDPSAATPSRTSASCGRASAACSYPWCARATSARWWPRARCWAWCTTWPPWNRWSRSAHPSRRPHSSWSDRT